jgi:hypothetical protein
LLKKSDKAEPIAPRAKGKKEQEWSDGVKFHFFLDYHQNWVYSTLIRWRSSMVEQLICNQQVAGSIPIASSRNFCYFGVLINL